MSHQTDMTKLTAASTLYGGLLFLSEIRGQGLSAHHWRKLMIEAKIERRRRGLYVIQQQNSRLSWLQHAIHVLPKAVISHEAAAVLHGFKGFEAPCPVVTVHSGTTHVLEGVVVRRNTDLTTKYIEDVNGLRVTTKLRTIVDLAYSIGYKRFRKLLDEGRRREWFDLTDIEQLWHKTGRRGKPGAAHLRRYVKTHQWDPKNHVRQATIDLVVSHGLPEPVSGVRVPWNSHHRFPLAIPSHKIAIRLIGSSGRHRGWADRYAGEIAAAEGAGWAMVYLSNTDISVRAEPTIATIRNLLAAREPV